MKILVIGSGGREYAVVKKISQSPLSDKIYVAPGNAGMKKYAEIVNINVDEYDKLVKFAKEEKIDLTVVGPENPLADGIVDIFEDNGLVIFGVNKKNAQFEASKDFTKKFLNKYNISTAKSETFTNYDDAKKYLLDGEFPIVLKADGLFMGKGVFIAKNYKESLNYLDKIFNELKADKLVIEQYLNGKEISSICLVSHNKIFPLEFARDYKKIYDNDLGENTGGVGSLTPVDDLKEDEIKKIKEIQKQIENGFINENCDYTGILFIGLMLTDKPYVLEFNVRFGDPEIEVILEKMKSDLLELILKTMDGTLNQDDILFDNNTYVGVVLCSKGYPGKYEKNKVIEIKDGNYTLIHSATKEKDGEIVTNGGRVAMVISGGKTRQESREEVYKNIKDINFDGMYFRKDIAK